MRLALVFGILFPLAAEAQDRIPLTELTHGTYLGFPGGLYPGGNEPPADHRASGLAMSREIQPLDRNGLPASDGRIVLLSIGMSNTTQEFCSAGGGTPCASWSFTGQALASPDVERDALAIVNGAKGGQAADAWDSPDEPNYTRIREDVLRPANLSPAQVQVAWVKVANRTPQRSLPAADADAYVLVRQIGDIVRAMKLHYPNLRIVFLSSRIYAGYATGNLNPEPYAYESGFAVKWLIEAQIEQMRHGGNVQNPLAGNLDYNTVAPWVGWGPYLWANGLVPRADGLVWEPRDFASDGTHPSRSGEEKVGAMLLHFFRTSELTRSWFTTSTLRRRGVRR